MPDELLGAVRQLTEVVTRLETTLREEYPKRAEVERKFTTKKESMERRRQWIITLTLMFAISLFLSVGVTATTVSYCFLTEDARLGQAPVGCEVIPGYAEAQKRNKDVLAQFEDLLRQPAINDRRLDRIERELGIKPRQ